VRKGLTRKAIIDESSSQINEGRFRKRLKYKDPSPKSQESSPLPKVDPPSLPDDLPHINNDSFIVAKGRSTMSKRNQSAGGVVSGLSPAIRKLRSDKLNVVSSVKLPLVRVNRLLS
jgi:hypothetical protein